MSERVHHCPFLNRADSRCSSNFSLDQIHEAFDHCFDRYNTCDVYHELLLERRVRRAEASVLNAPAGIAQPSGATRDAWEWRRAYDHGSHDGTPYAHQLVQLTVSHRDAKHAAADAVVPAAPRL